MIVVIGGMQRSGSTFSFNIARDLLSTRGTVFQAPENSIINVVNRSGHSDYVIVKSHDLDDSSVRLVSLGAAKSICTIRKPEDAIASWMETFSFTLDESIDHMKAWIDMFYRIKSHSLVIDYELIDRRPLYAALKIARYLGIGSPIDAYRISRRHSKASVKAFSDRLLEDRSGLIDIGFSKYDPSTFYHRCHVSTLKSRPAVERLPRHTIVAIRSRLGVHLDDGGRLKLGV